MKYQIAIGEKQFDVEVGEVNDGIALVTVNNTDYQVKIENYSEVSGVPEGVRSASAKAPVSVPKPKPAAAKTPAATVAVAGGTSVVAPIPGLVLSIKVDVGDPVSAGQIVATMEAMKMENNLVTNVAGTVQDIRVQKGNEVSTGDIIMVIV